MQIKKTEIAYTLEIHVFLKVNVDQHLFVIGGFHPISAILWKEVFSNHNY